MPRRTAALTAAGLSLLTAIGSATMTPAHPAETSATSGPATTSPSTPPSSPGPDGSDGADGGAGERFGRTPYERRLLDARRRSVDLEPVVGGSDRPNILVLMVDDMRDDDLQFLPNVQRLITDRGVRFTNALSPHPLCCPARASFLTGLYSHNHEVWSHKPPFGFRVLEDRQTLPVWLRDLGYSTTFLGKYLNGYGRQRLRDGGSSLRYIPPGWTDWRGAIDNRGLDEEHLAGGTYRYFDTTLNVNGRLEPHNSYYQTHLFSQITQQVVRDRARSPQPFFMWTSFVAPHGGTPREKDDPAPVEMASGMVQRFPTPARPDYVKGRFDHRITRIPGATFDAGVAGKPYFIKRKPPLSPAEQAAILESYRQRVETLSVVDDEVANIVESLERTGELDNTYVVLTSDNGYFLGENRMRRGKILPYEPSLRVPLVVRGPGLPEGEVRTDPFLMTDFAPTLVDAAGGGRPPVPVDGQSMLEVAEDGDRGWTRGVITETGPRYLHARDQEALGSRLLARPEGPSWKRFSQGVRTARYLYVEHASRERELYDLLRDPHETHNLVDDPSMRRVVRALARELDRLRDCLGPSCTRPLPPFLQSADPVPAYYFDPSPS